LVTEFWGSGPHTSRNSNYKGLLEVEGEILNVSDGFFLPDMESRTKESWKKTWAAYWIEWLGWRWEWHDGQDGDAIDPRILFHQRKQQETWKRNIWGWPRIKAELTRALEEEQLSWNVLNIEKIGMKFNENMVIFSELIYRNKIFLNLRNMK